MTSLKDIKLPLPKEWPLELCTPSELVQAVKQRTTVSIIRSPLCSRIVLQIVGSYAYLLANVFNRSKIHNIEVFNEELRRIEAQLLPKRLNKNETRQLNCDLQHKVPLLTFSNHISCIDDPILWASLFPTFSYYSMRTESVRWSAAAVDICFTKRWHSTLFSLGKTFPIMRGDGLNQPAMHFARALLDCNQWLHLFPEGRVMRDDRQQKISNIERGYIFKWGMSKLILDYFNSFDCSERKRLRILPFYHLGLDEILPIGWPYIPRFNKEITIFIRPRVIDLSKNVLNYILKNRTLSLKTSKSKSNDEITRIKLTNYLEEELERLIEPATKLHYANKFKDF